MDTSQKLIIGLLVVAIVFSLVSISLNMSFGNFKKIQASPIKAQVISTVQEGNNGGEISVRIRTPGENING